MSHSQMAFHHLHLLLLLAFLPQIFSDLNADQSALLRLSAAVRGGTQLWNATDPTPCSWKGVKCDNVINRVIELRLPGNRLIGKLPGYTIGILTELRVLSLRGNALYGQLPSDLSSCYQLHDIHLQGNGFSGEIPEDFFNLTNLVRVNLARNNFTGNLSSGFDALTMLRTLYLEDNRFVGSLPDFNTVTALRQFNVSFNELTGSIPSNLRRFSSQSFLGTSLCGGPLVSCSSSDGDSSLSSGEIAGIAIGSVVGFLLFLVILFILWRKYRKSRIRPETERAPIPPFSVRPSELESWNHKSIVIEDEEYQSNSSFYGKNASNQGRKKVIENIGDDGLVFFGDNVKMFTLQELLKSSAEVLGKGIVGSTYKAYLESGFQVIVKRLKNVSLSESDFQAKIKDVGSLVHGNLLPLNGYFYGREEKLLVYEPVANGSLYALLHGNNKQTLSWEIKSKIALGTARAIEYLHSNKTTHGNIKSSNIFLKHYYDVCLSEFGLTQLVSSLVDTNGYQAPEVTDSRKISQNGDVYSFGVVFLELLTSKDPNNALTTDGMELPNWVQSLDKEENKIEVFDPDLLRRENLDEKMVPLLHLALSCTAQYPERRPSMVEITRRIEEICVEEIM